MKIKNGARKKKDASISISSDNIECSIKTLIGATLNCDLVPNWSSHPPAKSFHGLQFLLVEAQEIISVVVYNRRWQGSIY